MRHVIFDLDVMRSFVAGVDLGSFAKASARVGRSTSAVSAQLKRLEEQAGTPLFRKEGRGLALTEAGETLLSYARRLLDLNDEAASAVRNVDLDGLALQLRFSRTSESMAHHDSEVMGWQEPRSGRRWSYGPHRCGM